MHPVELYSTGFFYVNINTNKSKKISYGTLVYTIDMI